SHNPPPHPPPPLDPGGRRPRHPARHLLLVLPRPAQPRAPPVQPVQPPPGAPRRPLVPSPPHGPHLRLPRRLAVLVHSQTTTPPAGGARDLPCVNEHVDERNILAEGMDHLDRETDAGRRRLGQERSVGVAVDPGRPLPARSLAPAAQDEQRVTAELVEVLDGAANEINSPANRLPLGAEAPVGAEVRDPEAR